MAQEIARESLKDVLLKIMQLLVHLVRGHRTNSEHTTKYFNSLYQHMHVQEAYMFLSLKRPEFKTANPKKYIEVIGEIFKRAQKNSMFVHADRSSSAIIEYKGMDNKGKSAKYLGYDSVKAIEIIERS